MNKDNNYEFVNFINFEKKKKIISNLKKKNKIINNNEYILVDTINYDLTKITLDLLKKNNHITERFIPIDLSIFIKQIEKSFQNNKDIFNQFKYDLNRSKFTINNFHITDPSLIKDYLDYRYDQNIVNKILMLSTQASLGMPFELIQNSIEGKYFSEVSPFDKISKVFTINLDTLNDKITLKINKNMRIFELVDCDAKTICYVNIDLDFDLLNDRFIMMKLLIKNNYI